MRPPESSRPWSAYLLLPVLLGLALVGNVLAVHLFMGFDVIFGSVAVFLVLELYGLRWGLVAAFIAAFYTTLLWGHPYSVLWYMGEALWMGLCLRKERRCNPILAEAVYWTVLGGPMVWVLLTYLLKMNGFPVWLVILKQYLNGLANILIASALVTFLPLRRWAGRSRETQSLRVVIFYLLAIVILVPGFAVMALYGRNVAKDVERAVQHDLEMVAEDVQTDIQASLQERLTMLRQLGLSMQASQGQEKELGELRRFAKDVGEFSSIQVVEPEGFGRIPQEVDSKIRIDSQYLPDSGLTRLTLSVPMQTLSRRPFTVIGSLDTKLLGFAHVCDRSQLHRCALLDHSGKLIAQGDSTSQMPWPFEEIRALGPGPWRYHRFPSQEQTAVILHRWQQSSYLYAQPLQGPWPLSVLIEAPLAPHQYRVHRAYGISMASMLGMMLLSLVFADLFSRRLARPLVRLSNMTSELLANHQKPQDIVWPTSSISELDVLIQTFRRMDKVLYDRFEEIEGLNRHLEHRITLRTHELLKTNLTLQALVKAAPVAIFILDQKGTVELWNPTAERIFGWSENEVQQAFRSYLNQHGQTYNRFWDQIFSQGSLEQVELQLERKDGELVDVRLSAALLDHTPQQPRIVGLATDITDQIKAQQALRQSEERLSLAFQAANEGVWDWNPQTNEVYFSPPSYKLVGLQPEQLSEGLSSWRTLIHPEDLQGVLSVYQKARYQDLDSFEAVFRLHTAQGSYLWALVRGQLVQRDEQGKALRMIGTLADITELKQAQEDRIRLEAQLMQAQKLESIGRLAGGVAHDFNNLLSPIICYAEMGLEDLPPEDSLRENLEEIHKAGERARNLTSQLLAFSRKQVLEIRSVDLNALLADFEKMLRRFIGEDIELQTHYGTEIPPVRADASQLEQIILNLVINARDAMPQGGQLVLTTSQVTLRPAGAHSPQGLPPGSYVLLSVSDTGCGMSPKTLQHIFEPFFTTKEKGKGTGLGLAMVYGIVKQHSGAVEVQSELGQGTSFHIYLPLAGDLQEHKALSYTSSPRAKGKERVLVVEDDQIVRRLACSILQSYGYEVLEAHHPEQALTLVQQRAEPINLVLTDVIMPGMNGRDMYQKMAELVPRLKVVFMSGYTENILGQHGILNSDIRFVSKPFTVKSLTQKVRQALDES